MRVINYIDNEKRIIIEFGNICVNWLLGLFIRRLVVVYNFYFKYELDFVLKDNKLLIYS